MNIGSMTPHERKLYEECEAKFKKIPPAVIAALEKHLNDVLQLYPRSNGVIRLKTHIGREGVRPFAIAFTQTIEEMELCRSTTAERTLLNVCKAIEIFDWVEPQRSDESAEDFIIRVLLEMLDRMHTQHRRTKAALREVRFHHNQFIATKRENRCLKSKLSKISRGQKQRIRPSHFG